MHRCLAIQEILYAICEAVRDDIFPDSQGTLAALARTCRIFQEPALDNLWYTLDSLCPLVRCLPREAWEYSNQAGPDGILLAFTRGLIPSDIETIRRYSQRVRVIGFYGRCAYRVETSSLQIIDLLPGPIFPNLRQLTWWSAPTNIFPYLRPFFSKQLVSVDISIDQLEAVSTTLINLMPSLLSPPTLRSLRIYAPQDSYRDSIHFSPIATNYDWSALRTLSLPCPAIEDIVGIGNLPNLQQLTFTGQLPSPAPIKSSVVGLFTSLRTLGLDDHPIMLAQWLPFFRNAKLVQLSISSSTDSRCSDQEWRELFINLNKNVDHGSLRILQIQLANISVPTLQASDILPPLLCFTELRSFMIRLKRSLPLSHSEVLELTKSWPNVTLVDFTPTSFEPEYCSKLSSLSLWSKYCPKLETLQISVDASDRDDRLDLSSRLMTQEFNTVHSSLSYLNIGNSPITHKEFVALFLLKIFPKLKRIASNKNRRRRWPKVLFLMSLMRASGNTSGETIMEEDYRNLHYWWADRSNDTGGRSNSDEASDG